jgi:hypothetical protein
VHARAVSAYAEILMHRRDAQKVLRKALRPEWPGFDETSGWAGDARGGGVNNAERAAIAEAVLGMEVNRLNLAWLVVDRARSAYEESLHAAGGIEAFGVDALEETLRGHADARACRKNVYRGNGDSTRTSRYLARGTSPRHPPCSICTGCANAWFPTSSTETDSPCSAAAPRSRATRGPTPRTPNSPSRTPCQNGSRRV